MQKSWMFAASRWQPVLRCTNQLAQFPYGLRELAHWYKQYAGMMAHYETVMPGTFIFSPTNAWSRTRKAKCVACSNIANCPSRRAACGSGRPGAPCGRPGEQVRKPIYRDALQQWRSFEPWLGPLKDALMEAGTVATAGSQRRANADAFGATGSQTNLPRCAGTVAYPLNIYWSVKQQRE